MQARCCATNTVAVSQRGKHIVKSLRERGFLESPFQWSIDTMSASIDHRYTTLYLTGIGNGGRVQSQ